MIIIHTLDGMGIYAGSVTPTDAYAPIPIGVELPPPTLTGTQVARWLGSRWEVLPAYPAPTPAPVLAHITKLAFRNRFTSGEKVMMEIASLDNPAATMAQRQQAAMLRANLADTAAATFIDLARADTRAGVQMLETAGLLGNGRALTILDAPVQMDERPL